MNDFNLLCELNVFNAPLMNDAVYKFKRYEDASLTYTGLLSRHADEAVGLFDTVISVEEYDKLYSSQQSSMSSLGYDNREVPNAVSVPGDVEEENEPESVVRAKPANKVEEPLAIRKTAVPVSRPETDDTARPDVPVKRAPTSGMDTSDIRIGTKLKHKAFGTGIVRSLNSQYISVKFNDVEKKFKFPAALHEGFLETL